MNPTQYIRAIRNVAKRAYAEKYLEYLRTNGVREPVPFDLSYLAAQAVRIRLDSLVPDSDFGMKQVNE
jgi:hypothetical protein